MTRRTRYFLFGSSLVLVLGLCTGLVAYYGGGLPLFKTEGPAELVYVPAGATGVAFADVHQIMNSDFRKRLHQAVPSGVERDKLLQETGIDLERDIDTVVAGFSGSEPSVGNSVVLIRGHFDRKRIESLVTEHGGSVEEYNGKQLYTVHDMPSESMTGMAKHGDAAASTGGLVFLEPGLIALGNTAALKRSIDARGGENITKDADLMHFVADVDKTGNAWVVGRMDSVAKSAGVPDQVKERLAMVKWFTLSTKVDGGVSGVARVEANDDKNAEDIRALVNGGLAAAHLMSGRDSKLDAALSSLQLSGTGKTVTLSFTVTPEILDMLSGAAALHNLAGR